MKEKNNVREQMARNRAQTTNKRTNIVEPHAGPDHSVFFCSEM